VGSEEHRRLARDAPVTCALVTVSDTRTEATDESGRLMRQRLEAAGHRVSSAAIVPDEPARIRALLAELVEGPAEVLLLAGGTGITRRDRTYEAVTGLLEKQLPGFGELFRALSYEEIGAAAMLSRATAGVYRGRLVVSMPGSAAAVRLAMDRLIVPELSHLAWELVRQGASPPGHPG
jgi:molybdenum cofactor biosynthesis protein B